MASQSPSASFFLTSKKSIPSTIQLLHSSFLSWCSLNTLVSITLTYFLKSCPGKTGKTQYCSGSLIGNLIYRQYGPRLTLMIGGILCGSGLILWALLKSLFALYIGVGLFVGLGFSFVILVGNATLSRYFKKRRPQGMAKPAFFQIQKLKLPPNFLVNTKLSCA